MELKETNPWAILVMFMACLLTAWLVSQAAYVAIVAVVGAIAVLLLTMLNLKFTLIILVFSMLLSPEIALTGANESASQEAGRSITIRIDDMLLALICVVWLVKGAVQEDVGFIHYSPINKYIFAYLAIALFATTFGILDGIVTLKSGFFFFLKYCEYFVLYFIEQNIHNIWNT